MVMSRYSDGSNSRICLGLDIVMVPNSRICLGLDIVMVPNGELHISSVDYRKVFNPRFEN